MNLTEASIAVLIVLMAWTLATFALFRLTAGACSREIRRSLVATLAVSLLRIGWAFASAFLFFLMLLFLDDSFGFRTAQIRAWVTKARFEIKSLAPEIPAKSQAGQLFPLPVDTEGGPVAPTRPSRLPKEPVGSVTPKNVLYYVGPSFLPSNFIGPATSTLEYLDPFHDHGRGRYGYGAGIFPASRCALILTSRGPDEESQAERLEALFLEGFRGDEEEFLKNSETRNLIYSPTNGVWSHGDLYHVQGL